MKTPQEGGERIKHLREEKNYSQDYLANKLGISQKAYSKIESGQTKLSVDHVLKIAEILKISINTVLEIGISPDNKNFYMHNSNEDSTVAKVLEANEKLLKFKDEEIIRLVEQNQAFLKTIEHLTQK